jgi:hypothetical protein
METVKHYAYYVAVALRRVWDWRPRKRWDRLFRDL